MNGRPKIWWRFYKSIRLGKYARLNLSRSGVGVSFGVRGTGLSWGISPVGGRLFAGWGIAGFFAFIGIAVVVYALLVGLRVVPNPLDGRPVKEAPARKHGRTRSAGLGDRPQPGAGAPAGSVYS